jgi:hypothetical protein
MNAPTPTPSTIPSLKLSPPESIPTVTGAGTIQVVQKTEDVSLTDQLQGWGTVGAVVVALLIALAGWWVDSKRRQTDRTDGERQRAEHRDEEELLRAEDREQAALLRAEDRE